VADRKGAATATATVTAVGDDTVSINTDADTDEPGQRSRPALCVTCGTSR
jgi:hypothetical protein